MTFKLDASEGEWLTFATILFNVIFTRGWPNAGSWYVFELFPAYTKRWPNAGLMLDNRLRRCANNQHWVHASWLPGSQDSDARK